MGQYSIKDLEQLSGIKAHTLRIWEKRYEIITPKRTSTNIRYYNDDDLKKVLKIATLNNNGIKISKIANFNYEEISSHIKAMSSLGKHSQENYYIENLIIAMIDLDEMLFNQTLYKASAIMSFEKVVTSILFPFLNKIGVLWLTGNINPAQEHFVSHLVRQKIIAATEVLKIDEYNDKTILLYLPENELHELGLLFANYIARSQKYLTIYLGQTVPYEDLVSVIKTHNPSILITNFTSIQDPKVIKNFMLRLAKDSNNTTHFISGYGILNGEINFPEHVKQYANSEELLSLLG